MLGASGLTVERSSASMARARELAPEGPFGVNAQLAAPTPATGERERILEVLSALPARARAAGGAARRRPRPPSPVELLECALAAGVSVIATFDDPAPVADATLAAGAHLLPIATTVDEARARSRGRRRRG